MSRNAEILDQQGSNQIGNFVRSSLNRILERESNSWKNFPRTNSPEASWETGVDLVELEELLSEKEIA